jgi:enoyl-CoA hydratase
MTAGAAIIERTERDGVVWLRMAHGKANAMDLELLRALTAAMREVTDARAVVLTGTGGIFSAGVDLFRLTQGGGAYVRDFIPALSECFHALFAFPGPVVAAMNGHAIAGGAIIGFASDRRVMVRGKGTVGVPEVRVGVPFPWLPLEIVRFAVPVQSLNDLVLRGEIYGCDEALRRGLVDELVDEPELAGRAEEIAREMAAIAPIAFRESKLRLRRPVLDGWERVGRAADAGAIEMWSSDEVQGAVRDYIARTLKPSTVRGSN